MTDFLYLLSKYSSPIDRVQKRLQDKKMNMHRLIQRVWKNIFFKMLKVLFQMHWKIEKIYVKNKGIETIKRIRFSKNIGKKRSQHPSLLEEIETEMKQVVDIVIREMNQRFTRLHILDDKFGFQGINCLLYFVMLLI